MTHIELFQFTHPGKGATEAVVPLRSLLQVSIHAPWEGCDAFAAAEQTKQTAFQFTHPGKGATPASASLRSRRDCFNSRTLGRVRPERRASIDGLHNVSIHAPWEGCDLRLDTRRGDGATFQFTHPGKGATHHSSERVARAMFQFTHPGKGATGNSEAIARLFTSFNSRTLGRVRRSSNDFANVNLRFNSRTLGRVRQCGAKVRIIGRINKRNLRLGVLS